MKVGIITYHSAYNFGSVLQAYATQQILKSIGCDPFIINYRIPFQKDYYGLLGYGTGLKAPLKKIMMIPQLSDRKKRAARYEHFITKRMNLTQEFSNPVEAERFKHSFDIYISGSDQIWNLHSNEFIHSGIKYMEPYLLKFTNKTKISYASSITNMKDYELLELKPELEKFTAISAREQSASQSLSKLLNREIPTVLDPTLLIDGESWLSIMPNTVEYYVEKSYVLYYSLKNYAETKNDLVSLVNIASKNDLLVVALTPLIPLIKMKGLINAASAGPWEFINLVHRANMIVTDSYHGTLFSINLKKNFMYLRNKNGDHGLRASQLLDSLSIKNRMIDATSEVQLDSKVDYNVTNLALKDKREQSIEYLKNALSDI